jgi:hypothetical protein
MRPVWQFAFDAVLMEKAKAKEMVQPEPHSWLASLGKHTSTSGRDTKKAK